MAGACDPNGLCPRCGYRNGPGVNRCLRCRAVLTVAAGCSGKCTGCFISALTGRPDPESNGGRRGER